MLNIIIALLMIIFSPVILIACLAILALVLMLPIALLLEIWDFVIDVTINNKKD